MSTKTAVKDKYIQIKIDEDTKNQFTEYCKVNSINASELLRKYIQEIIKKI